jgi:hypothetical protein
VCGQRETDSCMDDNLMDEKKALKKFIGDLAGHKNFLWFTVMNLIQVLHKMLYYINRNILLIIACN